ncbi:MAG: hypothetical protein J0L97_01795 [Alphaproteobacteria bacterium]|nr:hypothetical protein [Alphaproteobacteria bacterium]
MHLFRYWAHAELPVKDASGNQVQLRKWRGSNTSAEEVLDAAKQAVAELTRHPL